MQKCMFTLFTPVQLKMLHFQCQCPEWQHFLESQLCPSIAAHDSCFPHQTSHEERKKNTDFSEEAGYYLKPKTLHY